MKVEPTADGGRELASVEPPAKSSLFDLLCFRAVFIVVASIRHACHTEL